MVAKKWLQIFLFEWGTLAILENGSLRRSNMFFTLSPKNERYSKNDKLGCLMIAAAGKFISVS